MTGQQQAPLPQPLRQEEWAVERLHPDPANAELFDALPDEELTALGLSIKAHGLINPIAVQPDGTIIAGEQRWRAAQQAGVQTVAVRVYDADERALTVLRIAENLHRRTLKPSEMTRALVRLHQALYGDENDEALPGVTLGLPAGRAKGMAKLIGYSAAHVSRLWARQRLVDDLARLEEQGLLDPHLSRGLCALPAQQQVALAGLCQRLIDSEGLARDEARQAVDAVSKRALDIERDRDTLRAELDAVRQGKGADEVVESLRKRLKQREDELERALQQTDATGDAVAAAQERARLLEEQLEQRDADVEALLGKQEQEIARLRDDLSFREYFERSDPVHKALTALLPCLRLDPQELVARLSAREGMGHFLSTHAEAIEAALPWLERYRAAVHQTLGAPAVSAQQFAARRARRAVVGLASPRDDVEE